MGSGLGHTMKYLRKSWQRGLLVSITLIILIEFIFVYFCKINWFIPLLVIGGIMAAIFSFVGLTIWVITGEE